MGNLIKKSINQKFAIGIIIFSSLIVILAFKLSTYFPSFPQIPFFFGKVKDIKKFFSEEEFKTYLEESEAELSYFGGGFLGDGLARIGLLAPQALEGKGGGGEPERVSETTVQVAGVDEPDIVKTDGKEIYFSPGYTWRFWEGPVIQEEIMPPPERKIKIMKAFPPADLAIDADIDKSGDLLLDKNNLVIFSGNNIYGYNVSNPKSPEKKWDLKLEGNSSVAGARLYKNKIYLITKTGIDEVRPCPIKPLIANGQSLEIKCLDIYHPISPIPVDVTFTAMILDPGPGKIEKNISFIGSSVSSIVYMSEKSIYVTYSYYESIVKFFSDFLQKKAKDLVPSWLIEKMKKLESYEISQTAKITEFQVLWERYLNSLSNDERLRIENEITNRMSDYYKTKKRDLEKTGIIKIKLDGFEVIATGAVPGSPLNQFSLDEYNGYFRIATTVGERWAWSWGFGFGTVGRESTNDVYVLDGNLEVQGQIQDLGLTERIYSARFIEDKGYLVTFRQTDPFYVLDLSNPKKPELKGELKIPGYSSYLHPITKDKILGIGKESWQVKISLFDTSSSANPIEKDKYILDESWSDILDTHHAFLLDKKHEIFFLPGSRGGYVFSYKDDKLSLTKAVSDISARRAIYINDYLYIIGDDKITVLNEIDWEKVKELEL